MKKEIKVLDCGFVRYVDHMGDDRAIAEAARVSYLSKAESTEGDSKLIHHLYSKGHTSPFEMVEFKFHIKLPLFVMRQLVRHRTASLNEISARYTSVANQYYLPSNERIAQIVKDKYPKEQQDKYNNKLLSLVFDTDAIMARSFTVYGNNATNGMPKELARIVLPVSMYTQCYWKIDLHNLLKFLGLRLDKHAQYEIREFAKAIAYYVSEICPIAYEAFLQNHPNMGGCSLSHAEVERLLKIVNTDDPLHKKLLEAWNTYIQNSNTIEKDGEPYARTISGSPIPSSTV